MSWSLGGGREEGREVGYSISNANIKEKNLRKNRIDTNPMFSKFGGRGFSESQDAPFAGAVRRLVRDADDTSGRCDIDDGSPRLRHNFELGFETVHDALHIDVHRFVPLC